MSTTPAPAPAASDHETAQPWLLGVTSLVFSTFFMSPVCSFDFWWHISLGKLVWQTGEVPAVDTLSYLAYGERMGYIGWFADALLYLLYSNFGAGGVVALKMACGLVMLLSVSWIIHQLKVPKLIGIVTLMISGLLLIQRFMMARPFVIGGAFTMLLLAMVLWTYRNHRLGPLLSAPLIAAVWIACHGTALLLYGVLAVLAIALVLSRAPWKLVGQVGALGLVSAVPLFATRTGADMLAHAGAKENVRVIMTVVAEWTPVDPTGYHVWGPWLFALLGLGLALARSRDNIRDWWLPLGLMASSLFFYATMNYRGEYQGLLFMIYPMVLGLTEIARWLERRGLEFAYALTAVIPVALMGLAPPGTPATLGAKVSYVYPHKTVAKLRELPPGRLAHRFGIGGYLMWHGIPGGVFGDGRTAILFDDSHLENYWDAFNQDDGRFNRIATELGIRYAFCVSYSSDRGRFEAMGWRLVYESDEGALFERPESLGPAPTSFENAPPLRWGAQLWLEGEEVPDPLDLMPADGDQKMKHTP